MDVLYERRRKALANKTLEFLSLCVCMCIHIVCVCMCIHIVCVCVCVQAHACRLCVWVGVCACVCLLHKEGVYNIEFDFRSMSSLKFFASA